MVMLERVASIASTRHSTIIYLDCATNRIEPFTRVCLVQSFIRFLFQIKKWFSQLGINDINLKMKKDQIIQINFSTKDILLDSKSSSRYIASSEFFPVIFICKASWPAKNAVQAVLSWANGAA